MHDKNIVQIVRKAQNEVSSILVSLPRKHPREFPRFLEMAFKTAALYRYVYH